jgi:hypothetical protein
MDPVYGLDVSKGENQIQSAFLVKVPQMARKPITHYSLIFYKKSRYHTGSGILVYGRESH